MPGAAGYEVEINAAQGWSLSGKVCCEARTIGTSLSLTKIVPNNRYYWRVRAVDASGNAANWNVGPAFDKYFDVPATKPSIPNLLVRTPGSDGTPAGVPAPVTWEPIVRWDPVVGASGYRVRFYTWDDAAQRCIFSNPQDVSTVATALSPVVGTTPTLGVGATYCVGVAAYQSESFGPAVYSPETQLKQAFKLTAPPASGPSRHQAVLARSRAAGGRRPARAVQRLLRARARDVPPHPARSLTCR